MYRIILLFHHNYRNNFFLQVTIFTATFQVRTFSNKMLDIYLSALDPFKTVFSPVFETPVNIVGFTRETFLEENDSIM